MEGYIDIQAGFLVNTNKNIDGDYIHESIATATANIATARKYDGKPIFVTDGVDRGGWHLDSDLINWTKNENSSGAYWKAGGITVLDSFADIDGDVNATRISYSKDTAIDRGDFIVTNAGGSLKGFKSGGSDFSGLIVGNTFVTMLTSTGRSININEAFSAINVQDDQTLIGLIYAQDYSVAGKASGNRWIPDIGYNDTAYWKTSGITTMADGRNEWLMNKAGVAEDNQMILGIDRDAGDTAYVLIRSLETSELCNFAALRNSAVDQATFGASVTGADPKTSMSVSTTAGVQFIRFAPNLLAGDMGITDTINEKGLVNFADYSANFTALSLITKGYADGHLGGQDVDALVITPTATEDGYVISWNDTNSNYELTAFVGASVGLVNVVQIANGSGGFLDGGSAFNPTTGTLQLGANTNAVTNRQIVAAGSNANVDITLTPKGTGIVKLDSGMQLDIFERLNFEGGSKETFISGYTSGLQFYTDNSLRLQLSKTVFQVYGAEIGAVAGQSYDFIAGIFPATSTAVRQKVIRVSNATVNQSGSALGYTGIEMNIIETATIGSDNWLIDLQTDSNSQFRINNTGGLFLSAQMDQEIRTAHIQLTQAQIKDLDTTPIQIIAAPGAGKHIQFIGCSAYLNHNGTTYATATVLTLEYGTTVGTLYESPNAFISSTGDKRATLNQSISGSGNLVYDNEAMMVSANANATNDGGTIDVWIQFAIVG